MKRTVLFVWAGFGVFFLIAQIGIFHVTLPYHDNSITSRTGVKTLLKKFPKIPYLERGKRLQFLPLSELETIADEFKLNLSCIII